MLFLLLLRLYVLTCFVDFISRNKVFGQILLCKSFRHHYSVAYSLVLALFMSEEVFISLCWHHLHTVQMLCVREKKCKRNKHRWALQTKQQTNIRISTQSHRMSYKSYYTKHYWTVRNLCQNVSVRLHTILLGSWRCDSVVGMSVFGWQTFPDLCLTCDHFVGKVFAMGQWTRPTRPSIFLGSVNE